LFGDFVGRKGDRNPPSLLQRFSPFVQRTRFLSCRRWELVFCTRTHFLECPCRTFGCGFPISLLADTDPRDSFPTGGLVLSRLPERRLRLDNPFRRFFSFPERPFPLRIFPMFSLVPLSADSRFPWSWRHAIVAASALVPLTAGHLSFFLLFCCSVRPFSFSLRSHRRFERQEATSFGVGDVFPCRHIALLDIGMLVLSLLPPRPTSLCSGRRRRCWPCGPLTAASLGLSLRVCIFLFSSLLFSGQHCLIFPVRTSLG